jgi:hypothetical protein
MQCKENMLSSLNMQIASVCCRGGFVTVVLKDGAAAPLFYEKLLLRSVVPGSALAHS